MPPLLPPAAALPGFAATLFVLWAVVGYVLLRAIARRAFKEPHRAEWAAAAVVAALLAGVALDPFRAAPSAPVPPAATPAPGAVAATRGRLRSFFVSWQRGRLERADFAGSAAYAAAYAQARDTAPKLRALGRIEQMSLVASKVQDGVEAVEYLFVCARGSELMGAYLDGRGRVLSVGFQSAPTSAP
jgi:hypothetical protein